jgi:hypothetical protein
VFVVIDIDDLGLLDFWVVIVKHLCDLKVILFVDFVEFRFEGIYFSIHFLYLQIETLCLCDLCVENGVDVILTAFQ